MNVFITYAKSDKACQIIEALRQALRANNINVWLDTDVQTPQGPEEGWIKWMRHKIRHADWVLILFDDKYRMRYDGEGHRRRDSEPLLKAALLAMNCTLHMGKMPNLFRYWRMARPTV